MGSSVNGALQWNKAISVAPPFFRHIRIDTVTPKNDTFGIMVSAMIEDTTSRDTQYIMINTFTADSESVDYAPFRLFSANSPLAKLKIHGAIYTTYNRLVLTGGLAVEEDPLQTKHLFLASIGFDRNTSIATGANQEDIWGWYMQEPSDSFAVKEDHNTDIVSVGYYGRSGGQDLMVRKYSKDGRFRWNFFHELDGKNWNVAYGVAINENNEIIIVGAHGDDEDSPSLFVLKVSSNGRKCGTNEEIELLPLFINKESTIDLLVQTYTSDVYNDNEFSVETTELEVVFEKCENENVDQTSITSPTYLVTIGLLITLSRLPA